MKRPSLAKTTRKGGSALSDHLDAFTLRRFLRAEKGKQRIAKAAEAILGYLEWREREKVDEVFSEKLDPELDAALTASYSPRLLNGKDLRLRPIVLTQLGRLDLQALEKQGISQQMVVRRQVRELERLRRAVEASAYPDQGHLAIFDLQGMTVSRFRYGWGLISEINKIGSTYYPDLMGTICIINAPTAVVWAIGAVKAILHPDTAAKIQTKNGDPTEALARLMPASLIPPEVKPGTVVVPAS